MKSVRSKLAMMVIPLGVLCSCAFKTDYVQFDYTPSDYSATSTSDATIQVDRLKDARGVDSKLISYKGVAGRTGGQYINDTEISELLTNSIKDLLVQLGYTLDSPQSDLTLTGEVLKFDSYVLMGFWSGSIEAIIQLNLKLLNNKDNTVIWSEIMSASGKQTGVQIDRWDNRKIAFDLAMDNLMRNIASSETLRTAINSI